MTSLTRCIRVAVGSTVLAAAIAASQTSNAQTTQLWTAGSGTDTNWSTPANWSAGVPGALDTAVFGTAGESSSSTIVGNALSADITVSALKYTNTDSGMWQVTDIPAGVTLTTAGLTLGGVSGSFVTSVAFTDAGTLAVNGSLSIGNTPAGTPNESSVADFSGLSNLVVNTSSGTVTVGPANYSIANVSLASSNSITAGTISVNLNDTSSTSTTTFKLGAATNNINAGTFNIAGGRNTTTVSFPAGSASGLRIRGVAGTDGSLANMQLGYHDAAGSGSHASANLSLNGTPVDIQLGTVLLGRSDNTPTGTSYGQGLISFDTGTLYASNVIMATTVGAKVSGSQYFAQGIGAFVVGANGTLILGPGGVLLVNQTNNAPSSAASVGGLIINGGTVISSNSIVKANTSGTGSITNNAGTLDLVAGTIGTATVPIDNLNLSGGTLRLNVDSLATSPNINVTILSASGPATINIDSVANVTVPVIIHLIAYNSSSSGDQFSGFTLGTVPAGYTASLADNAGFIDLSISPAGSTVTPLLWVGAVNSSWDLTTMNWLNTNGVAAAYSDPDFVHFDDSALNSTVTLAATFTPASLTFTNNGVASGGLDYTLNGSGALSGLVGLFKDGSGSVTLAESGGDNFTGGVTVNNGTVILDDANSAIAGSFTINFGATLQVGANDANGNITPGAIQNNGTLVVNQSVNAQMTNSIQGTGSFIKQGDGTLTLSATNGYTGNTTVFGGGLALTGAGTISNSSSVTFSNATLDLSGVAGTTLLNFLTTSNSAINLAATGLTPPLEIASAYWLMGGSSNTVNISALPPIASYPVTFALAQSPGGVTGFNLQLGTLPAATPPYTGSVSLSADTTTVLLTISGGPTSARSSVVWAGTNGVSATTNWSDRLNWQLPGAPTASDNVIFTPNASAAGTPFNSVGDGFDGLTAPQNVNNFVDADVSIGTLLYTNVGGSSFSQNTFITNDAALNVLSNGSLTVGTSSSALDFGAGATEFVTIGGTNGTFNVNNTNGTIYVGLGDGSSGSEMATLDLSGLGTFNASVSRFLVGVGANALGLGLSRAAGTVYLAQTNNITAAIGVTNTESSDTGANAVAFDVGENDGNTGMACFLYLGQTNAIFADAIGVGRQKTTATMEFNVNLINNNTKPSAYFRGASTNAVDTWSIGDEVVNSGSGENANGTVDFSGGYVDAMVNNMYIGRASGSTSSSGTANGTLSFDNGVINVATLYDGYQPAASSKQNFGTVNVKTNATLGTVATLAVSGTLNLGVTTSGAAAAANGTLNIDGGIVSAGAIACGGTNSISLGASGNGGTLSVANTLGTSGAPVGALTLNGNTLLSLPANTAAAAVVSNLTIDGQANTTNILNISSVSSVTPPVELPVIQYTTLNNTGGTFNLGLGTLPAGYSGYFTNDTTLNAIAVVITNAPTVTVPPTISQISIVDGNIVISGTNNLGAGGTFHVLTSTNIATPLANWTVLTNSSFDGSGNFNVTNAIDPTMPAGFYILRVP